MTATREAGHRVLVVEDVPDVAEQLRAFVESRGDRPRIARTVSEALAALAEERFCYILCDQQLPTNPGDTEMVSGGERVLKAARQVDLRRIGVSFHVMPIIVVTSYSSHSDFVSKMYDLGASAFMEKPVKGREERLQEKVSAAMERVGRGEHEACEASGHSQPVAAEEPAAPAQPGGIAAQLGATSFANIAIKVVDGHTIRITHQRHWVMATYIDLGFVTKTRKPNREWPLFLDICAGQGKFRWKKYGGFNAAKQKVHHLRKKLSVAFGLAEDPFHDFRVVDGWRARFFASSDIADDDG